MKFKYFTLLITDEIAKLTDTIGFACPGGFGIEDDGFTHVSLSVKK
jgi:hypothetical protein